MITNCETKLDCGSEFDVQEQLWGGTAGQGVPSSQGQEQATDRGHFTTFLESVPHELKD